MSILTVWHNASADSVRLHQLSDDPADGTPQEQVSHLSTLSFFDGFICVSEDYQGAAPETDVSLWRWDGSQITSLPAPPAQPSIEQVRGALAGLGMNQAQLDALFSAATNL